MEVLRRVLPPINALVVFEAAARHLNFTHAASELGVSQAAVSRQISLLEDDLGVMLFERMHRTLKLTRDGLRLQQAVTMGLEHIANTAASIRRIRRPGEVTLSTSVTFASYWLIGRLAKFRSTFPSVEIRLVASAPVRDLVVAGIDIAVRYGRGDWPGVTSSHLFGNDIWPICSPDYLKGRPRLREPQDLLGETLLHLDRYDRNWVTWHTFFDTFRVDGKPSGPSSSYDNYMMLLQAALRGQGIALCGGRLAEDFVRHGTLVRPIPHAMTSDQAFYLIAPAEITMSHSAKLVRDWLIEEAKGD